VPGEESDMSYESFETIKVSVDGAIATVTISREAQLNALSSKVLTELTHVAGELEVSSDVRVVILTGAGKAFVAGADISEMAEMTPVQARAFAEMGGALGEAIETSEKPWIAAVNGFALGGGCELALACDFIHASDKTKLGQPEVKLGVIPGFGGTQRLARRVGVAKCKELCMTGDGEVKRLVHEGQSTTLEHALKLEQRSFGLLFATADQREGMAAFLAKRTPQFKGQ
jgi:enoyl-CoA hydratase